MIPIEYFPGKDLKSALDDLGNEAYRHIGVRDDLRYDQLVKSISSITSVPNLCFQFLYITWRQGIQWVNMC
jgi:hypothetical protein